MNRETLNAAITLGQMMTLLTPVAAASKLVDKQLSRLRSIVNEQVITAVLDADTETGKRAALCVKKMQEALLSSIKNYTDAKELINCSHPTIRSQPLQILKKAGITGRHMTTYSYWNNENTIFEEIMAIKPVPASSASQEKRAEVGRAYASAVRNSSWLTILMQLGVGMSVAASENEHLTSLHSSHQGRAKLEDNLRILCPTYSTTETKVKRTSKKGVPAIQAEGFYEVQVVLSMEKLLAQKEVADLFSIRSVQDKSSAPLISDLLSAAVQPVTVGENETAESVGQAIVNKLVADLMARKKVIDAEAVKAKAQANEATKAEAVQALQKLNPKLLKALKENPDLLKSL